MTLAQKIIRVKQELTLLEERLRAETGRGLDKNSLDPFVFMKDGVRNPPMDTLRMRLPSSKVGKVVRSKEEHPWTRGGRRGKKPKTYRQYLAWRAAQECRVGPGGYQVSLRWGVRCPRAPGETHAAALREQSEVVGGLRRPCKRAASLGWRRPARYVTLDCATC